MSEQTESYDDLVKTLKPFKVIVKKISNEEFVNLKVIDDPNRIRDECLVITINEDNDVEEEDEEIEIDINAFAMELNTNDVTHNGLQNGESDKSIRKYSCFFCKNLSSVSYIEAFNHFQLHIDYYPIQCSICDEAITDIKTFVIHCNKTHPELKKVKYINKFNSNCFNWIENYLKSEKNEVFMKCPQMYCPACDWIQLNCPDINNPNDANHSNAFKPSQILSHIHEHIQYKPFQCSLCRDNDQDFRVHVLDGNTIRKHFFSKHMELIDDTPNWKFFNHKYSIPSLDKFIINYLGIFGLKVPKKKKFKKKKVISEIETNLKKSSTAVAINGNNNNIVNQQISIPSTSIKTNIITNNSMVKSNVCTENLLANTQFKQIFTKKLENMENPLLISSSSNTNIMRPILVDSTDIGIVCIDPRTLECDDKYFKYICVFCEDEKKFATKIEAIIHYSIHLNYYPINCLLCEQKFIDLSALLSHYKREHNEYENNIFHYLKEDQKIENWINDFLDFQKTHEFLTYVSVTYGDYCFVCKKLSNANGIKMKCSKNDLNGIRDHVNHHLRYFPYKCLVCLYGQKLFKFGSINKCASDHIKNSHFINNTSKEDIIIAKLLAKSDEIVDLEKLIDKQLFPKRDEKTINTIEVNLKRKLDDMLEKDKKLVNNNTINTFENKISPTLKRGNGLMNSNVKNNSVSLLKSPHMNKNGIKELTTKLLSDKSVEYIPNRVSYVEPFLLCFHCHTKVLNTNDLQSHHQSKHPKLTIASYSPTKLDVIHRIHN